MADTTADEARELEELAERLPDERAQLLTEAAWQWSRVGDVRRAGRLFEMAISDGGGVEGDALTHYARFLFEHGDTDQANEVLTALWTARPADPLVYMSAGDLLVDQDNLSGANRWFTAGATRRAGGAVVDLRQLADDPHLAGLLEARAQVRRFDGQPADEWDRIWFEHYEKTNPGKYANQLWTPEYLAEMRQENARLEDEVTILHSVGRGAVPMTLPYWPRSEIDLAIATFPTVCADLSKVADPHAVHRRTVERALRTRPDERSLVVPLTVDSVHTHAARSGVEPDRARTHQQCATLAGIAGAGIAWPPGRNDPCWCGSGCKYKKCCGAPGFAVDIQLSPRQGL